MNHLRNQHQPAKQGTTQKLSVTHTQVYQGHLPPPDMLQHFNEIDPSFAGRIVSMAELEQKNRHDNETRLTKSLTRMSYLGIVFAFLSVLIMSGLVFYSLWLGFSQTAGAIAVGSIAAVASVFIFFKRRVNQENK